jgi:hypothetical protein
MAGLSQMTRLMTRHAFWAGVYEDLDVCSQGLGQLLDLPDGHWPPINLWCVARHLQPQTLRDLLPGYTLVRLGQCGQGILGVEVFLQGL